MATLLSRLCVTGVRGLLWNRCLASALPVGVRGYSKKLVTYDQTYKDKPWEYLDSPEYLEIYGDDLVWTGYRRNHKGSIPPQKTRKKCIRKGVICGNPCPICRDQKLHVDYRNVKLLKQFICPYTGVVYDQTRTGVCQVKHKKLEKAIIKAEDFGLLPVTILNKDLTFGEYSYNHGAIAKTLPAPKGPWYSWYPSQEPPAKEVARLRKMYRPHLKMMMKE